MRNKTIILAVSLFTLLSAKSHAQVADNQPKGQAIVQIFGDFHSGFGKQNSDRGFALERCYLGYQYKLSDNLTVKGVMDAGRSSDVDDYHRIAYLKNAQITYITGAFVFNGGLISTTQFHAIDKLWGYRYVSKSFQDEYKFGSSADLGLSAQWKPNSWFAVDGIIVNGEGYKKLQIQDGLLYGVGTTFTTPFGITLRLYASVNEQVVDGAKNIQNYSAFIGYQNNFISIGAEYDWMLHAAGVENHNQSGYSAYVSAKMNSTINLFARYDCLSSKEDWNLLKDESKVIVGAQWKLGNYVKVAPNVRIIQPKMEGADTQVTAYVSCFVGI